ncbi:MAG: cyclase family protein, partial [Bacteriovorax sp.]|nr:cyclase family protein [Bacteriovorax sp.]
SMEISKETFLRKNSKPLKNKAVLFCTGLDKYWEYGTHSGSKFAYFFNPFLSSELADYLVEQEVLLVGSDSLQLECPLFNISHEDDLSNMPELIEMLEQNSRPYAQRLIHSIFLEQSICLVENLKGLDRLLPGPAFFVAAPLKLAHPRTVDNSPTRAFAMIQKNRG